MARRYSTTYDSIPWQVGLVGKDSELFCSGALLSEQHIISAAHCLKEYKENPGMKRMVLIGGSSMRRFISYVFTNNKLHELSEGQIVHPDFQEFNWRRDEGTFYIFDFISDPLHNQKQCYQIQLKINPHYFQWLH